MCQQYWTLETCGEKFGPFIVETTAEIKSDPSMTVRDFTITNTLNVSLKPSVDCDINFVKIIHENIKIFLIIIIVELNWKWNMYRVSEVILFF